MGVGHCSGLFCAELDFLRLLCRRIQLRMRFKFYKQSIAYIGNDPQPLKQFLNPYPTD